MFRWLTKSTQLPLREKLTFILKNKNIQLALVALLAVACYGNTLLNQFALDDGMVILENKFVLKGVSGIPDILTHDSFYGAIGNSKNLTGGRYRPLSLVAFAIETSLFGKQATVYHLFNLLYYLATCMAMFLLLRKFIFHDRPLLAFIATLIFTVHPIHTEVVANIKSRDELMSLLFLLLTLYFLLDHLSGKKKQRSVLLSLLFFVLALLSKENGIIFIGIIPITLYFFSSKKAKDIAVQSVPFWIIAACYLWLRLGVLPFNQNKIDEVMDNPYLLASLSEKYATIFFVLIRYAGLLFWPHPLSYDYSYQQIPYRNFGDLSVWFAIFLYSILWIFAVAGLRRKDLLSWCILFYLAGIFIISNLALNIGAPMAERFLFQATVPFSIFITALGSRIFSFLKASPAIQFSVATALLLLITGAGAYASINRNRVWQSNETLFLTDVKTVPGSARANTYAGVALIKLCDEAGTDSLKHYYAAESIHYFKIAEGIKKDYITTLLNMGVAYSRLDSLDAAEQVWARARIIDPGNANFKVYDQYLGEQYYTRGMAAAVKNNLAACISDLERSVKYDPKNANAWYNLGGACFTSGRYEEAKKYWEKTLAVNPNLNDAANGLRALQMKGY